ncbi:MAG: hypothetical protein HXY41_01370 [Chloroflexi bacterium]|nr:hypothetical protein [Chloroflexota bacterium]
MTPVLAQEAFECPSTGGTLITAIGDNPVSLNGIYANDGISGAVLSWLFNPLTLGGENWGTQITGDLAESYSVSDDGLTWTFNLHQGVKFHDGEELTADDVVYTFQTIQTSEEDIAPFRPRFYQGDQAIQFEAPDDYTVVARLAEPNASFFTDISVPIVPRHVLEGQDLREGPFNRQPVGTGPFKVVEWVTGESITLEAHEEYFRGRPCLDRLIFRIIPDEQAQVNALLTGEIDFLLNVPGASVAQFQDNAEFTFVTADFDSQFQIVFNMAKEQFQDKRVRQALMIAIDRQALVDTVRQGFGVVQNSHFDSVVPFYSQDKLGGYDYDPERAGQLLDEAGITDSDGDGVRDLNGQPWVVNLLTFQQGFRNYFDYATVVQAYWQDIGIQVELETRDLATMVEQLYQERIEDKPYDVLTSGWSQIGPEPNSYANFYITTDALGPNLGNYNNPVVNDLFAQAQKMTDFDERMAVYEQIEAILWDELPALPLYRNANPVVISNRFNIEAAVLDLSISTGFQHPERIYQVSQ